MLAIGYAGIVCHFLLLLWLAPIAFLDAGEIASDWSETLIPFGLLIAPLLVAGVTRTSSAFYRAGFLSLVVGALMFIGPGIFLLLPAVCYLIAGAAPQTNARACVQSASGQVGPDHLG